jgi:hypothetical protein
MRKTLAVITTAATLVVAPATAATADDDDREIERSGSCSGSTDWKFEVKEDDGGLEIEFEVDSNRSGQVWRVRVYDNGDRVVRTRKVTRPPSGSFDVERHIADRPGEDRVVARARHRASGELCRTVIRF